MKFLALIFFACVLQSTFADSIQDAIQKGSEEIAQLKLTWQKQIPEIENTILDHINAPAAQFAEAAAHVAKQVKDDAAKLKAAEDVKVAYEAFVAEMKKSASKIANTRPDVLAKEFDAAKLANAGYEKISKVVDNLKEAATGNTCKEGVVAKFVELAAKAVSQVTQCVLEGGSNFPGLPKALVDLRRSAVSETKQAINWYNRCVEEVGTGCFDKLVEHLNTETKTAVVVGDNYVVGPHPEVDFQKNVSNFCIKRRSGVLNKQIPDAKGSMDKC